MANDFKITISAVDKVTATVRKINASMDKIVSPITNFQKSIAALKNEVGLNVITKGMKNVGRAAKDIAERVMSIAAPMAALIGVGTIGGIAALVTEWGRLGFQITNTANAIGISTGQLQGLRGAASMAGVAASELDGGLKSIGDTLQNAQFGRNQDALMMMNRLGISVHRLKDGSVDAAQGLMDISKSMQGRNVEVQRLIANSFGVGSLLPLLQKGPAAIAAYQKKYEELAGIMGGPALKAAADFEVQMTLLHASVDGLKNRLSEKLIPILSPLVEQFTRWIAANKDLIATKVGAWVEGIANWVKKLDFDAAISGVKGLGIAFAALLTANLLGSLATFATSIAAIGGLIALSNPITAVAVAVAALAAACVGMSAAARAIDGGDTDAKAHPGERLVHHGRGQGTWKRDMSLDQSHYGETWVQTRGQLGYWKGGGSVADFMAMDASGQPSAPGTPSAPDSAYAPLGIRSNNPLNMLSKGRELVYKSPEDGIAAAVANLRKNYRDLTLAGIVDKWTGGARTGNTPQQTANYVGGLSKETGVQPNQAPDLNNPMIVASLVRAQIRQENGQQPYGDSTINNGVTQGMAGGAHKISVHVDFANAPPGTTAKARSSTGGDVPTRIAYAMPTTVMP